MFQTNPQLSPISVEMRQSRPAGNSNNNGTAWNHMILISQQCPNSASDRSCLQVRIQGAGGMGRNVVSSLRTIRRFCQQSQGENATKQLGTPMLGPLVVLELHVTLDFTFL